MNIRNFTSLAAMAFLTVASTQNANAHGDTIHLYMSALGPSVAAMSDTDGSITPQRAFLTNWNWIATQGAFSTSDPGWNWDASFAETDVLSFQVLTSLQRWDGTTFVDAPFNARIRLGTDSVTTGDGVTQGFGTTIGANDHFHFRYNLDGVAQTDPAATGVYRLNFLATKTSSVGSITYPGFGLVLNRGADAATAEAALAYANVNPVPEPGSLVALGFGIATLLRKRVRKS